MENFADEKGWLDEERFGYKNGDEVWANISQTPGQPVWVFGTINGTMAYRGGEPLTEKNVTMFLEYKVRGKKELIRVRRPQLSKTDPRHKGHNQLSLF